MSFARRSFRVIGATLIGTASLAACSGPGVSTPSQPPGGAGLSSIARTTQRPNWITDAVRVEAKSNGLIFVADAANNDIAIFPKLNPKTPIGTITDAISDPEEIAVDASANLYVTNLANNDVTVYAPPYTAGPIATYSSGLTYPFSVTVGTDGTTYVSANPGSSSGEIVEYPKGSLNPALTIPIGGYTEGVALDAKNELYVGFNANNGSGDVLRFAPHSKKFVDLKLPIAFVSGVVLDKDENLIVEDQIPATVDVFAPGSHTPSKIFNNGGAGFGDPVSIAFGTYEKRLYVGDGMNSVVDILDYPSGKTIGTISGFGRVHGVAVSPPAPK